MGISRTEKVRWRKSSYSASNGGECVECAPLGFATWRKSTHSSSNGGDCAALDDRAGRTQARRQGVRHAGTLELVAQGIRDGVLTRAEACRVIGVPGDHEACLPCDGSTFLAWGTEHGYLEGE